LVEYVLEHRAAFGKVDGKLSIMYHMENEFSEEDLFSYTIENNAALH